MMMIYSFHSSLARRHNGTRIETHSHFVGAACCRGSLITDIDCGHRGAAAISIRLDALLQIEQQITI
jgi:hypothetical protein